MTNTVYASDGEMRCSCGAKCPNNPKRRNRFLARHPKLCSDRRDFAHQLAQSTRSVEDTEPIDTTTKIKHYLATIDASGRDLTDWEEGFRESVAEQFKRRGWLTDRQRGILGGIYADKT